MRFSAFNFNITLTLLGPLSDFVTLIRAQHWSFQDGLSSTSQCEQIQSDFLFCFVSGKGQGRRNIRILSPYRMREKHAKEWRRHGRWNWGSQRRDRCPRLPLSVNGQDTLRLWHLMLLLLLKVPILFLLLDSVLFILKDLVAMWHTLSNPPWLPFLLQIDSILQLNSLNTTECNTMFSVLTAIEIMLCFTQLCMFLLLQLKESRDRTNIPWILINYQAP